MILEEYKTQLQSLALTQPWTIKVSEKVDTFIKNLELSSVIRNLSVTYWNQWVTFRDNIKKLQDNNNLKLFNQWHDFSTRFPEMYNVPTWSKERSDQLSTFILAAKQFDNANPEYRLRPYIVYAEQEQQKRDYALEQTRLAAVAAQKALEEKRIADEAEQKRIAEEKALEAEQKALARALAEKQRQADAQKVNDKEQSRQASIAEEARQAAIIKDALAKNNLPLVLTNSPSTSGLLPTSLLLFVALDRKSVV